MTEDQKVKMHREMLHAIDASLGDTKRRMQDAGYYVRLTEWHEGFQVCLFNRTDFRDAFVSKWHSAEYPAWQEALGHILQKEKQNEGTQS